MTTLQPPDQSLPNSLELATLAESVIEIQTSGSNLTEPAVADTSESVVILPVPLSTSNVSLPDILVSDISPCTEVEALPSMEKGPAVDIHPSETNGEDDDSGKFDSKLLRDSR